MNKDEALCELYALMQEMDNDGIVLSSKLHDFIEKICDEYEDELLDLGEALQSYDD